MNNSNFGYDCRNNIANCTFAPISDKLDKASYLKKYQSLLDNEISKFVFCEPLKQEIESSFNSSLLKLKIDGEYFDVKKFV